MKAIHNLSDTDPPEVSAVVNIVKSKNESNSQQPSFQYQKVWAVVNIFKARALENNVGVINWRQRLYGSE